MRLTPVDGQSAHPVAVLRTRPLIPLVAAAAIGFLVAAFFIGRFVYSHHRPGWLHYRRGLDYAAANEFKLAEREWDEGIKDDPGDYHCYEMLGDYDTRLLKYDQAIANYRKAADRSPTPGTIFGRISQLEDAMGNERSALADANRAVALLPHSAQALSAYGALAIKVKDHTAAAQALHRAHDLSPDDSGIMAALAQSDLDTLDLGQAERDLKPFLRAHPEDASANFFMAVVYNQKPRTRENLLTAVSYAERAREGMGRDLRVYTLLGQLYLDLGRTRDALATFVTGIRIREDEAMLNGLLQCFTRLGNAGRARQAADELNKVIARNSRIDHLKEVMGFTPNNTAAGLELARLEEQAGNQGLAEIYYQQLFRQAPHDPRTRLGLADFYQRSGMKDRAKQVLKPGYKL